MELKLFEEQMRTKNFDKITGKRLHAIQAARPKNAFMDGTTFDVEGNPLISQKGECFFMLITFLLFYICLNYSRVYWYTNKVRYRLPRHYWCYLMW